MSHKMNMSLGLAVVMMLIFTGVVFAQTPAATEIVTDTETTIATDTVTGTVPSATGCPYGNYVDEDGDGECDNRQDTDAGQQWGPGTGNAMHGMMGSGMMGGMMKHAHQFTDADNDGICDNCQDGDSAQYGMNSGHGRMGRWGMWQGTEDETEQGMGRGMNRGWRR